MTSDPDKKGIGPSSVNGNGEEHDDSAPRPSMTAMLGSLLGAVEKPTAENIAEREAEAQARQKAIVVHSPHALMKFEEDMIRQMGRDPNNYIGVALGGQLQAQRVPNGSMVMILAIPIPPRFFPALDAPAVMTADGAARSAKFDRQLAIPITARVVIDKEGLGDLNGMHDNAILLQAYEGRTFGELLEAGYVPPPGQAVPHN